MKLVMDERFKHRMIGVLVITSIAIIFAPIIIKKPKHSSDLSRHVVINLPPKPESPKVEVPEAQTLFKARKVAEVSIPDVSEKLPIEAQIARAEPLTREKHLVDSKKPAKVSTKTYSPMAVKKFLASANQGVQKHTRLKLSKPALSKQNTLPETSKKVSANIINTTRYSVQLAVFSQQSNALNLVKILKLKGFKAFMTADKRSSKAVYRVLVGSMDAKHEAQALRQKLVSAVQLKGFIVPAIHTS